VGNISLDDGDGDGEGEEDVVGVSSQKAHVIEHLFANL